MFVVGAMAVRNHVVVLLVVVKQRQEIESD